MKAFVAVLMLVVAALVCVPQSAEAAIFGNRSRSVVVQRQVVRQPVVRQQVVRQKVVQQRVVQQVVQPVYVQPQAVIQQQVYVPQAFRQQVVVPSCNAGNAGVLQLNSGGCAALYGR